MDSDSGLGDGKTGKGVSDDVGAQSKTEAGEHFITLNLDNAVDYITHGLSRVKPVEPLSKDDATGKGILQALKQFLGFGDIISESLKGSGKNAEIIERTAKITYKSVRAYNSAINRTKGKTNVGYVKRFLEYISRTTGDHQVKEWADSLKYQYSEVSERTLYSKPGEKGYVTVTDAIDDLKTYYHGILTGTQQPERIGGYRQLVTAMWGLSTGMRPIETAKVEWEHLKTAVEQGYFEAPAIMTKTGEGRVIPLHPQVKPYIELLIKAGEDNPRLLPQPFNNEKFRKGRTKYGANLVLAQYRNLPVMEWRNHGIDPTVRLAIMGHDQHLVLDALRSSGLSKVEQEKVKAEELEASGEMTQTYGKLQPAGIASEYQKTVGKWKFIPKEISIKQITPLLEKQKK